MTFQKPKFHKLNPGSLYQVGITERPGLGKTTGLFESMAQNANRIATLVDGDIVMYLEERRNYFRVLANDQVGWCWVDQIKPYELID